MGARRAFITIGGIVQAFADRGITISGVTVRRLINRPTDPLPAGQLSMGATSPYVLFPDDLDAWLARQLDRRLLHEEASDAKAS